MYFDSFSISKLPSRVLLLVGGMFMLVTSLAEAQSLEDALLRASNAEGNDDFGWAVAIDGERAIVGARGEDGPSDGEASMGAVYVFELDENGDWKEAQILRASNGENADRFGASVAIDGDRAIVGAPDEEGPNNSDGEGAAYVFERDANGVWQEVQILRPAFPQSATRFGEVVAISGDRVLIGAPLADTIPLGADTGEEQAYVFNRTSSGWPQNEDQVLRPSSEASDFGSSVAIDGKHAIVGAPGTGNTPADEQMAFAYELTATESRTIRDEDQILRPSNAEKGDLFSSAVAIDGEDAFVGASSEDGSANGKSDAGATYLFQRTGSGWPTNEAKILRASNAEGNDTFGRDIATDKGRLLIGASGADGPSNNRSNAGAAYIFEQTSSGWAKNENQIFRATNAESGDFFGHSVAVGKGRAIIGAVGEDGPSNNMESGGAAYVFDLFSSLTLRDGSSDQLDFSADVSPGTSNNPVGILSLTADKSGAEIGEFTVTNSSPGIEGVSAARLYWSTDQVLDPATDTKLDELSTDASNAPITFGFDGFTQSIPTSTGYLIFAIDVEADASTSEVQFSIDQPSDLSTSGGRIRTVNGSDQTDFSGLPLSNGSTALPVEMTHFEGVATEEGVRLRWKTASETNNAGFSVLRRKEKTREWTEIGSVDGGGTTDQPQTYRFVDSNVPYIADSMSYRLRQVDTDGTVSLSEPLVVDRSGPTGLQLRDTAPNPARQQVNVRYSVPDQAKGEVQLRLYDVLGRQVRSVKLPIKSGRHRETLDISGLSSGMYVLHLQTGSGQAVTRKLTVVK